MARVVLDSGAVAELLEHLEVEAHPLLQALALEQLALRFQHRQVLLELVLDAGNGAQHALARRHVVGLGVDRDLLQVLEHVAAQGVEAGDPLDLVAEEFDADATLLVGRQDLEHVAAAAEAAVIEVERRPFVLHVDQLAHRRVHAPRVADFEELQHAEERLGVAQAVDARHRGDDQHVPALEQRLGGPQPQALDLVVDRGLFLDVGIGGRDVSLRLVVVVIGDEVLDGVGGEEAAELLVELRRQRLVVREHQGRAVHLLDELGDGEGLARAGDAEQYLFLDALLDAAHQLANGFGLVALRREGGFETETVHPAIV